MLWHHNARVNSHQRWKQTRFRVCLHLWCELTSTINITEWQVSWNSWAHNWINDHNLSDNSVKYVQNLSQPEIYLINTKTRELAWESCKSDYFSWYSTNTVKKSKTPSWMNFCAAVIPQLQPRATQADVSLKINKVSSNMPTRCLFSIKLIIFGWH